MGNTISTFWVLSQETLGLAPPSTGQQALREPTAALRVGFAKTEITAPEETPMGGYWLRGRSRSTHVILNRWCRADSGERVGPTV